MMKIQPKGVAEDGSRLYKIDGIPGQDHVASGTYTRKRGLQRTYSYDAQWRDAEQGIIWDAKVRHRGELKGVLGGNISAGPATPREVVILAVESFIAGLVGMLE